MLLQLRRCNERLRRGNQGIGRWSTVPMVLARMLDWVLNLHRNRITHEFQFVQLDDEAYTPEKGVDDEPKRC